MWISNWALRSATEVSTELLGKSFAVSVEGGVLGQHSIKLLRGISQRICEVVNIESSDPEVSNGKAVSDQELGFLAVRSDELKELGENLGENFIDNILFVLTLSE